MQTFLPFPKDFKQNAAALDGARLRKQGVECYQILRALAGESKGWVNHPATKMWRGYEGALAIYTEAIYAEIHERGWKADNIENVRALVDCYFRAESLNPVMPSWIFDDRVAVTHRSSLYRKDPTTYSEFAENDHDWLVNRCCARCNYFWPTHAGNSDFLWEA